MSTDSTLGTESNATAVLVAGEKPPLVPDVDADPMENIPTELSDLVGAYDRDTAGGCG